MTLYEYFKRGNDRKIIDHSLRAQVAPDGSVSFYIHPAQVSGDTADFVVTVHDPNLLVEGPWQADEEVEDQDPIPKDLGEAVTVFIAGMCDKDKELVIEEGGFPNGWHFFGGMRLRNSWGLWTGSVLARWFESKGITHADDMSSIIAAAVTAKLRGEVYPLATAIFQHQVYWATKRNGGYPKGIPPAPWREEEK